MQERLSDRLPLSPAPRRTVQPLTWPNREQVKSVLKFVFSWDHHRISWMKSNVLLRLFSLDNFLVLKLEARMAAIFRAQDHNAVFLGKWREAAGLRDQLQ